MKKKGLDKAIQYGQRLLSIRPRSEKELENRLRKKGIDTSDIKDALYYFREKNLVNDLEFAKAWVDSRMRSNPSPSRGPSLGPSQRRSRPPSRVPTGSRAGRRSSSTWETSLEKSSVRRWSPPSIPRSNT